MRDAVKAGFCIVNNGNGLAAGPQADTLRLGGGWPLCAAWNRVRRRFIPRLKSTGKPPQLQHALFWPLGLVANAMADFAEGNPLPADSTQHPPRKEETENSQKPKKSQSLKVAARHPLGQWRNSRCGLAGSNRHPLRLVGIYSHRPSSSPGAAQPWPDRATSSDTNGPHVAVLIADLT